MPSIKKKVFITGASRGIGLEVANSFKLAGYYVVGTYRNNFGVNPSVCDRWAQFDFDKVEDIRKCADFIEEIKPEILINNAGFNKNNNFLDISLLDFQLIQQVNLVAPFLFCQSAIKGMVNVGWGRIVNISSVWGKISMPGRAAYSASKFALDGMTLALANEYASLGILANCIAPGFINTDLTQRMLGASGIEDLVRNVPMHRLGTSKEIADLVIWLSSEQNTFISGQNISIDGGFSRA